MKLLGFSIERDEPSYLKREPVANDSISIVDRDSESTSAIVASTTSATGIFLDVQGTIKLESELVTRYRDMCAQHEVDNAVDEIVNEAMTIEDDFLVKIDLSLIPDQVLDDQAKAVLEDKHNEILEILDFKAKAYSIFKRWYVDGRIYYHIVVDPKNLQEGIKELRYVDPRKLREIKEVEPRRLIGYGNMQQSSEIQVTKAEYYLYNEKGFSSVAKGLLSLTGVASSGIRVTKDSIVHVPSGLTDTNGTMGLGYLHKAMRVLNSLKTIEDSVIIYRLARAPERRVWYVDIGNLPPMKAEQLVQKTMTMQKNKLIYDATTGQIQDNRKFMCMALDTRIPLLDGRTLELQEIIQEYQDGKKNWVYSCDPVTGKFAPGPVSWAGITKRNSEVLRVTLDNGESVVVTPDHKFPVWGKGLVEAKDLLGESIIPGYRRKQSIHNQGNEYEQIFCNQEKKWKFTHREVAAWKDSTGLREEFTYLDQYEPKNTIHHKDVNRFNNSPDNLVMMGWKDHFRYHSEFCNSKELREKNKKAHTIIYTDEIFSLMKEISKTGTKGIKAAELIDQKIDKLSWMEANIEKILPERKEIPWTFLHRDLLKASKQLGYKNWKEYLKEFVEKEFKTEKIYKIRMNLGPGTVEKEPNGQHKWRSNIRKGSDEWKELLSRSAKNRKSPSSCKTWKITMPDGEMKIIENLNEYCRANNLNRNNIKYDFGSRGYFAKPLHNHKVVAIDWLSEKMDTGCLTIDITETFHSHHTYLLDCGIYTKNTMLEDYWLPRRPDGSGTRVETLAGGKTLLEMEDVLYFQKLLYNSLNVPVERLQTDNPFQAGSPDEINRGELKFDKFITRINQQFSLLFRDVLKKQLVLQGLMTIEEFANIEKLIKYKFARDNHWAELKDNMIRQKRIETYMGLSETGLIGTYFSHKWVRHNIFQQTDDDILKMTEEIIEEMENPLYNQQQGGQEGGPEGPQSQVDQAQEQNAEADSAQQQADIAASAPPDQPPKQDPKEFDVNKLKNAVDAIKAIPNEKRTNGDGQRLRSLSQKLAKIG